MGSAKTLTAKCGSCGGMIQIPQNSSTGTVQCPSCGTKLKYLPAGQSPSEVKPPPVPPPFAPPPFAPPTPPPIAIEPKKARGKGRAKKWLFPLTVLLLGFGVVAFYFLFAGGINNGISSFVPSILSENKWRAEIKDYLEKRERSYEIVKWYDPESVEGARYALPEVHDFNYMVLVISPNDTLIITHNQIFSWQTNWLDDPGSGVTTINDEVIKYKIMAKYRTRLKNTRAIRVEYKTEEGFGRIDHHDVVFLVELLPTNPLGRRSIVRPTPTHKYRIGK